MKCWPTMPVAPRSTMPLLRFLRSLHNSRFDHALIDFHRFRSCRFGHALFERVRHVNRARPDQKRLAPLAAECRDIGGERRPLVVSNAFQAAEADGGDLR